MDLLPLLRPAPDTPLCGHFLAAGAVGAIRTNSESILAAARESFVSMPPSQRAPDFQMRCWVDADRESGAPWPQPYFGGLRHLIYAGFEPWSSLLINLKKRAVIGRFSAAMAADLGYWKRVIFPSLLGILGPSVGVASLHCACVARDGKGLLLVGGSGSGKSTLSMALAKQGFDFLSDDWTYFSRRHGALRAWGLPIAAKLLPEAETFFPELSALPLSVALNGERAYEIDPEEVFGARRSLHCEPKWVVFLKRDAGAEFNLRAVPAKLAASRLEKNLQPIWPEAVAPRRAAALALSRCACLQLRYSEKPGVVAEALAHEVRSWPSKSRE
jgi:hypothetical protein